MLIMKDHRSFYNNLLYNTLLLGSSNYFGSVRSGHKSKKFGKAKQYYSPDRRTMKTLFIVRQLQLSQRYQPTPSLSQIRRAFYTHNQGSYSLGLHF